MSHLSQPMPRCALQLPSFSPAPLLLLAAAPGMVVRKPPTCRHEGPLQYSSPQAAAACRPTHTAARSLTRTLQTLPLLQRRLADAESLAVVGLEEVRREGAEAAGLMEGHINELAGLARGLASRWVPRCFEKVYIIRYT